MNTHTENLLKKTGQNAFLGTKQRTIHKYFYSILTHLRKATLNGTEATYVQPTLIDTVHTISIPPLIVKHEYKVYRKVRLSPDLICFGMCYS